MPDSLGQRYIKERKYVSKRKTFKSFQHPKEASTIGDWVFFATLNENLLDKEHNLTNHRMVQMISF